MQIISFQRDLNWHLSNIIEMYRFIDIIVTTKFCHEFVRNISAKIGCNPFCYYLMVLNWHCIHDIENKKNRINFIPCSVRTICPFCQTIIFFGAIYIHCGGRHPLSVMVNTLFLKYISCFCSTSPLGNMPPATTHLKIFRPGQPHRLSACHLSMQHNHGLTRTVLCLEKKIGVQNCIPSIMFIKPTRIHLKPNEGSLKFQSLKILS
jgi:hypothetical protein